MFALAKGSIRHLTLGCEPFCKSSVLVCKKKLKTENEIERERDRDRDREKEKKETVSFRRRE